MLPPVSIPRTLSIMPTYQCTAACSHCGTYSHPKERTRLRDESILSAIDQAIEGGYRLVVFTGGEPTLAGPKLLNWIARAARGGLTTRLVTNGWWAKSDPRAEKVIESFTSAGLREINFSTGDEHARFVDLGHVLCALKAAARSTLSVICVMVELVHDRSITKAVIEADPAFRAILADNPKRKIGIIESPWMPLSYDTFNQYPVGVPLNEANVGAKTGCSSCLGTTTLQADGQLGACCGLGMRKIPELQLGNIEQVTIAEADANAADDFLKRWIRVEGPERILAWAAQQDASIVWENLYAHKCQSCARIYKDEKIRTIIKERHRTKIADVLFAEWLLYEYRQPDSELESDVSQSGVTW
jgi:organic radical activating enzyme